MNKAQKQVQQVQLSGEQKTIKQLQRIYGQARKDCEQKIRELSSRTDLENLQSIIYQKQYQEALKKQLDGILDNLQSEEFISIADYLQKCYENGYVGVMYDLYQQGIPIIMPINQEQVVKALQTDSKLSNSLYNRLGEDVSYLKKSIRAELSRGIANGSTWNQIAGHIANGMNSPFNKSINNAIRIARTEGHRIQQRSALDAQYAAKEKGADVLKQWDSTLDNRTRPHHRQLDGQIRELDEPFEVDGMKAQAPGHFGKAKEDCNCRCCLLQRARWALDQDELDELKKRASYFGLDKTADFDDFKKKYLHLPDKADTMDVPDLEALVSDYLNGTNSDRAELGEAILQEYRVSGVPVNVKSMSDYGYCSVLVDGDTLKVVDYNLNADDKRGTEYQVKTAFHEAYHASGNGCKTDYGHMDSTRWLNLEETFAESTAHYSASLFGITDLAPSYPDKLVSMLPRLKKLDEFSGCSTIADFGKVALEMRKNGEGSAWGELSKQAMRKRYNYSSYVQQYFPTISEDVSGYVSKIIENMPQCKSMRSDMETDLVNAMQHIQDFNTTLNNNESIMLNNAVAIAMNRIGVK